MKRITNENYKELGFYSYIGAQNPFKTPLTIGELAGCLNVDYSPRKILEDVFRRLAAYEDTGLEPEEVTQIKLAIMGKSLAEIKEFEGVSINRMIELTQAEKDERLVVLPDAKYTDADGEKALQKAMWTCGNTNNPVTRYTADAIAEKLCREARDKNPPLTLEELREMDGEPVWIIPMRGSGGFCTWMLVDAEYELCREAHGEMAVFENCGKTWLAYRRKPEEG